MENERIAGALLRVLRLQRNWSQETLCHGICVVSYLSKIEQGKVTANPQLLEELFGRLDVVWQESKEMINLRDALYEGIFSLNDDLMLRNMQILEDNWDRLVIGPCYADFVLSRAYYHREPDTVPGELYLLLDARQQALAAILQDRHEDANRVYPCPLTVFWVGEKAFSKGNYTQALEYFQRAYDQAAQEGYVHIMMYSQHFMANCCSDIGNLDAMYRHSRIAERLAGALGNQDLIDGIQYNIAATKTEFGDYEGAYAYFSCMKEPDAMSLHKLAICCEGLGRREEALAALDKAKMAESNIPLKNEMCAVVRYRLEHLDHLGDPAYGKLLMDTYGAIEKELHSGYARFHLRWVIQWLTANRQYRKAFEILQTFPQYNHLTSF